MWNVIFGSMWGWIGTAGVVVLICIVLGYFFPSFRVIGLAIAGVVISAASIYSKGSRDRAALEAKRRDEAVRKAQKDYADIDARPDTGDSVAKRLRDGTF